MKATVVRIGRPIFIRPGILGLVEARRVEDRSIALSSQCFFDGRPANQFAKSGEIDGLGLHHAVEINTVER